MSISTIQNFFKETITRAVTLTGATNIYVSALPTPDEGYVVISPSSSSLREIVYYTAKGTDSNGTYLTVTLANRGLGGTTAQTHAIGEPVRMNITAEHIKEISDALDQIVAAGAQDASTTTKGITKLSVAPASATEPIVVGTNDPRVPTADPTTLFTLRTEMKFGGTGADGALAITSGTTTIDLGGVNVFVKNYTSISITGTGKLAFSNPHNNGTIVILKSQGNVTLTSSTAPMIDASGLGAVGATGPSTASAPAGANGSNGTAGYALSMIEAPTAGKAGFDAGPGNNPTPAGGGDAIKLPTALKKAYIYSDTLFLNLLRYQHAFTGSGGGSGSFYIENGACSVGNAGRGGGALIIECAGYWHFTTTGGISVAGKNATSNSFTSTAGSQSGSGGGGGGFFQALYNFLTANTGTVTVSGGLGAPGTVQGSSNVGEAPGGGGAGYGDGGSGSSNYVNAGSGGNGGDGKSLVAQNTEFI